MIGWWQSKDTHISKGHGAATRFAVLCSVASLVALVSGCGEEEQTVVIIDSAPESGATVLIEGGYEETTPATITGLPVGTADILLRRDRYRDTADQIKVEYGPPKTYVIEMEPLVGYLSVVSTPVGAEVVLEDGTRIGETPIKKYPLPIGEYSYRVTYPNYDSYRSGPFEVKSDHQYGVSTTIKLKPQEGSILVLSRPSAAQIWINGAKQAALTPKEFKLPPAKYIIDVHAPGHVMSWESVDLAPNASVQVELAMQAGQVPAGMVLIPEGPFTYGSKLAPDEQPEAEATLPAFYIDKYEVTNAEFKEVFPDHEIPKGRENYPVVGVTWTQAVDYAQKLNKRLPTELEWEKAARGTEAFVFPWGNTYDATLCNVAGSKKSGPVERGTYIEGLSPYGCVDMAGNVYEWTMDWYQAYEGNTVVTKDYGQIYRVLRGGSFRSERFDVRCSKRYYDKVSATRDDYGFRCAMDVK